MTFNVWYIRHKNGQHYIGSSYMHAKFSSKKKPSLYFTEASAKKMLQYVLDGQTECDEDTGTYAGKVQPQDVELREAEIVLK